MRALLFDSWFDTYVGVVCMLAVVDGVIKKGELRPTLLLDLLDLLIRLSRRQNYVCAWRRKIRGV